MPMRLFSMFWAATLLVGCNGSSKSDVTDDTAGAGSDTGDVVDTAPPEPMATGNIDTRDGQYTAQVSIVRAFSFYSQNTTLIYGASNPAATCESVANALGAEGDYNPNDLFLAEHCNLVIQANQAPPLSSFDLQTDSGASVRANCAYEPGEWAWSDGFVGYGWYYSGQFYSPLAWKGTFSVVSTDEDESLSIELDLREWEGRYPQDPDNTDEHKASGRVDGTITTVNCPVLEGTPWF